MTSAEKFVLSMIAETALILVGFGAVGAGAIALLLWLVRHITVTWS